MEDKSVSYDPQGGGFSKSADVPRILARLPRVDLAAPTKITRTDEAETALHGRHQETVDAATPPITVRDAIETVRFDTFPTDVGYVEPTVETARPAPAAAAPPEEGREPESWLVRLEAALLPYERWVALAAVLAALGLTLTLLRSRPVPPTVETPPRGGFASTETSTGFAPILNEPDKTNEWASETDSESIVSVSASGPVGLPSSDGPRAQLVQRVLPVEPSEAIDRPLNDTPLESPAVSDGYPRTAAAVEPWDAQPGGTRR